MTLAFDLLLCALLIACAVAAVSGRDLFASIAFFIVYGFLAAIAWISLGAIDVALAEAAIGTGITGVLLIGAWRALRDAGGLEGGDRLPLATRLTAGLACLVFAAGLGAAVLALPDSAGLFQEAERNREALGLGNRVTAVLLGFRGYDTLLETMVLTLALLAVWSLTREDVWGGRPREAAPVRHGGVMENFGRLLPAIGVLAGVYLVWAGADAPGGAFQASTVLAAMWILIVLAGLRDEPRIAGPAARVLVAAGPVVFVAIALAGAALGAPLSYPEDWAKPVIVIVEYTLTLSIAAILALLVAGPARRPA